MVYIEGRSSRSKTGGGRQKDATRAAGVRCKKRGSGLRTQVEAGGRIEKQ